jgi:hypothetical protein
MDLSDLTKIIVATLAYVGVLGFGILTVKWMGRRERRHPEAHHE